MTDQRCPVCGSQGVVEEIEVFYGAPYRELIPGPMQCPNGGDERHQRPGLRSGRQLLDESI